MISLIKNHDVQVMSCNVGITIINHPFFDGWNPTIKMVMVMGDGANGIAIPTLIVFVGFKELCDSNSG